MNAPFRRGRVADTELLRLTTTEAAPGLVVVEASGDVDMTTAANLKVELLAAIESRPTTLVVDLSGVDFFNSSGITTLLQLRDPCAEATVRLRLVTPRSILRVLELVGLGETFTVIDSREDVAGTPALPAS